jgi:hypothetical protein
LRGRIAAALKWTLEEELIQILITLDPHERTVVISLGEEPPKVE